MKKIKFTLKGEEFNKTGKIDDIHQHLQEINRGVGVKKSKKTYSRKDKHKKKYY
jgi:hypothetical protein